MTSFSIASRILVVLGAAGIGALGVAGGCSSDDSTTPAETSANTSNGASTSSSGAGATGAGGNGVGGMSAGGAGGTNAGGMGGTGMGGMGMGGMGMGGGPPGDAGKDGPPCPRRPFLVEAQPRAGAIEARADWTSPAGEGALELDPVTRRALAEAWLEDGRHEHASIAAFARFTMLLVGVGAPPDLVHGSQRASLDEIAHARACFGLAERYAGHARGPAAVSLEGVLARPVTLEEVAALTVHEGCVGETLGVLLASEQLAGATDPAVRKMLQKVVRDEMRHAELAWRFVKWAISRGGDSVRLAVSRALAEATAETLALRYTDEPGVDAIAWRSHGRLTAERASEVASRALDEIVAPCARALLGSPAPADRTAVLA